MTTARVRITGEYGSIYTQLSEKGIEEVHCQLPDRGQNSSQSIEQHNPPFIDLETWMRIPAGNLAHVEVFIGHDPLSNGRLTVRTGDITNLPIIEVYPGKQYDGLVRIEGGEELQVFINHMSIRRGKE